MSADGAIGRIVGEIARVMSYRDHLLFQQYRAANEAHFKALSAEIAYQETILNQLYRERELEDAKLYCRSQARELHHQLYTETRDSGCTRSTDLVQWRRQTIERLQGGAIQGEGRIASV